MSTLGNCWSKKCNLDFSLSKREGEDLFMLMKQLPLNESIFIQFNLRYFMSKMMPSKPLTFKWPYFIDKTITHRMIEILRTLNTNVLQIISPFTSGPWFRNPKSQRSLSHNLLEIFLTNSEMNRILGLWWSNFI